MASSGNQQEVCLAAAVVDLSKLGVSFPGFVPDCRSDECARCSRMRNGDSTIDAHDEGSGSQTQERMARSMEDFFQNPDTMTNLAMVGRTGEPPSANSTDESANLIAIRIAKEDVDEENTKELDSIDEFLWAAARGENSHLLSGIDERCGFEEGYEMVVVNELHIGLELRDEAIVRR